MNVKKAMVLILALFFGCAITSNIFSDPKDKLQMTPDEKYYLQKCDEDRIFIGKEGVYACYSQVAKMMNNSRICTLIPHGEDQPTVMNTLYSGCVNRSSKNNK